MNLAFELIDPAEQVASASRETVESFLGATRRTEIGWHYRTDLMWLHRRIATWPRGLQLLDAGGGGGPLQFLLAEMGFDVVNIDLQRPAPSAFLRRRYRTEVRRLESHRTTSYDPSVARRPNRLRAWIGGFPLIARVQEWRVDRWRRVHNEAMPVGTIQWIVGNLASMPEIADASFDGVVSLSALEHVPLDELPAVLRELRRVVKPAGRWAITTSATDRAETWFHEPSHGLCFTPADLGKLFGAANVSRLDAAAALEAYAHCDYLRLHLAKFYRTSGHNGMPWGMWNPQYVPAGIFDDQRG